MNTEQYQLNTKWTEMIPQRDLLCKPLFKAIANIHSITFKYWVTRPLMFIQYKYAYTSLVTCINPSSFLVLYSQGLTRQYSETIWAVTDTNPYLTVDCHRCDIAVKHWTTENKLRLQNNIEFSLKLLQPLWKTFSVQFVQK